MADENQRTELPQEQPQQSTTISQEQPHQSTILLPGSVGHPSGVEVAPKTTWPEVVGMTVEEAERKIREDMPRVQFQVVQPNCFVTMDFNTRRVRLYVDSEGKVSRAPRIG
ncbi:subtilisin inhibitor CLSI-I-like [Vitis riparia]|uniref:subtilisin inhibitor CLSI-I-like n=1 Tax=Vitis riparia TaxID=96939 RepID=UPI00155AAF33|nr:subtilisin inhibitor CLSI-I-like [Vitis riparia]